MKVVFAIPSPPPFIASEPPSSGGSQSPKIIENLFLKRCSPIYRLGQMVERVEHLFLCTLLPQASFKAAAKAVVGLPIWFASIFRIIGHSGNNYCYPEKWTFRFARWSCRASFFLRNWNTLLFKNKFWNIFSNLKLSFLLKISILAFFYNLNKQNLIRLQIKPKYSEWQKMKMHLWA